MNNENKRSGFSTASMVCGICSLVTCCIGPLSIILGALSILFAVLPYRKGEARDSMSSSGLISGIIGIVLGFLSCIVLCASMVTSLKDPIFRRQLDHAYQEMYGEDFDEFWENRYGINIE